MWLYSVRTLRPINRYVWAQTLVDLPDNTVGGVVLETRIKKLKQPTVDFHQLLSLTFTFLTFKIEPLKAASSAPCQCAI